MFVSTASSLRLNIKPIIMLMSNDLVKAFLLHTNVNSAVSQILVLCYRVGTTHY